MRNWTAAICVLLAMSAAAAVQAEDAPQVPGEAAAPVAEAHAEPGMLEPMRRVKSLPVTIGSRRSRWNWSHTDSALGTALAKPPMDVETTELIVEYAVRPLEGFNWSVGTGAGTTDVPGQPVTFDSFSLRLSASMSSYLLPPNGEPDSWISTIRIGAELEASSGEHEDFTFGKIEVEETHARPFVMLGLYGKLAFGQLQLEAGAYHETVQGFKIDNWLNLERERYDGDTEFGLMLKASLLTSDGFGIVFAMNALNKTRVEVGVVFLFE